MNPQEPSQPQKARILIADDSHDSRAILSACLEEEGYEVETALDADEALVKGLAHRPDLFLLDVLMPRKDGFQLCRELRSTPVLKQTPIILITGLDSEVDRFKGIEAGCDDFLPKPVQRSELLARVQTLLRLHMYRSQLDERKTFEAVLHHLSDGILVLDTNGRIASLNASAARMLNLNGETARGQNLFDWIYRIFQISVPRRLLDPPSDKSIRFELSRPEQTNIAALFLAINLDVIPLEEGKIAGTVWTVRDVTQNKKEQKLHRTFLSLISHKLRTPIAVISEHASLMQDGLLGDLTDEQKNSVDRVQDQASRLKELVDKILNFTQVDEATWDHAGDAFILLNAIKATVSRVQARYTDKKTEIKYALPDVLYGLGISEMHFGVIIENLVDNAVKFCDKPIAEVTIAYTETSDGQHELSVGDNGTGIPHEEFERVFEEFYQIDQYFTGNIAGVGLGLSQARRLVEKAGGRIWIASELGKGTTFRFTLPVIGTVLSHAA
ncbi:MAG: response regulator [Verrucomicrobiae bacterium]|nr:response regulator [Verrucomicrobiae bacterium]